MTLRNWRLNKDWKWQLCVLPIIIICVCFLSLTLSFVLKFHLFTMEFGTDVNKRLMNKEIDSSLNDNIKPLKNKLYEQYIKRYKWIYTLVVVLDNSFKYFVRGAAYISFAIHNGIIWILLENGERKRRRDKHLLWPMIVHCWHHFDFLLHCR